jgi:hypothetical protein
MAGNICDKLLFTMEKVEFMPSACIKYIKILADIIVKSQHRKFILLYRIRIMTNLQQRQECAFRAEIVIICYFHDENH